MSETRQDSERKGNRLSKIVTRTGDAGTTGLGDGSRTTKDSLRIDAIGEVDELNSSLGVLLCEDLPDNVRTALLDIQNLRSRGEILLKNGFLPSAREVFEQADALARQFPERPDMQQQHRELSEKIAQCNPK